MHQVVLISALLFLFSVASLMADQSTGRQRVQLDILLADESRIFATLRNPDFAVRARAGEVKLASADRFRTRDGGRTIVLEWDNGDRLQATCGATTIEVDSLVGKLSIPLRTIDRADIRLRDKPEPIPPAKVSVSGQYAHHKTEYAYDGEIGQGWSSGAWGGWLEFDLGAVRPLGRIVTHLQFSPAGPAVHDVYVSDQPIGAKRAGAVRLRRFSGKRKNNDVLVVECGPEVSGRYVQVHCPSSRSWFNVRELQVFGRE